MAAAGTSNVEGADRFASTLSAAADEIGDLSRATKESADRVATVARANAPVVSGNLRSSIAAEASPGEGRVSAGAIYAPVIHNGWPARNIHANPFLSDALAESEGNVAAVFTDELDRVVGKIKGK
jgi:hypothetical protein